MMGARGLSMAEAWFDCPCECAFLLLRDLMAEVDEGENR